MIPLGATLLLLVAAAPALASTVPADSLTGLGDQHISHPVTEGGANPVAVNVENVGDVNGDGRDDLATILDGYRRGPANGIWVTFGAASAPSSSDAGQPGWQGMHIFGEGGFTGGGGWRVATGLGDVNGDGLGEIAIGGGFGVVVVFGRRGGGTVDTDALGDRGFWIKNTTILGGGGGGGHACCGTVSAGGSIADAGDQNGDGRPDVAFRDDGAVKVAFTPAAPAGASVDADALGDQGFTLDTGSGWNSYPLIGTLGDLNGDRRDDLVVQWTDESVPVAHAVAAHSPAAGATVQLPRVAEDRRGFELSAPGWRLEHGLAMSDQNGDGRRDVGLILVGPDRKMVIAYSPAAGVQRDVTPTSKSFMQSDGERPAGDGREVSVWSSHVTEVGDQDGDGRQDLAFSTVVHHSGERNSEYGSQSILPGPGGAMYWSGVMRFVVGSVADRNGDGRREIVTAHASPYVQDTSSTWKVDVWSSAPRPAPVTIDAPAMVGGNLTIGGSFVTNPAGGLRALAARPRVELTGADGRTQGVASEIVDATAHTTSASVRFDPVRAGLVAGQAYRYRVLLENSRGLVGASEERRFTYTPATTARRARPRLSLRTTPRRDRRRPFRVTASGRLTRPAGVTRAAGCRGSVRLSVVRGRRIVLRRTIKLSRACTYRGLLRVGGRRLGRVARRGVRLRVRARFTGNARLLAADARAASLRLR